MRTLRQQTAWQERERNRAHDARQAGVSLAHFKNGRDRYGVACCRDCGVVLVKGAGTRQERYGRLRMVCRDRAGCEARVAARLAQRGAQARALSREEW